MPKFDDMNETDVREMIVRPLLTSLGYAHGTEASIRTEQTFRYGKAFLGRKNAKKDPDLAGRADYILEVASYGRWVAEVKAPSEEITRDAVEQAHTYAAHPEVAALFFLVTNGRKFHLYRTSSLDAPLMAWAFEEMDEIFLALGNLVSPDAIKRKVKLLVPDAGKPLAAGVASNVQIIGGFVRYEDHESNHALLAMDSINGLELPITSGRVSRASDGRLHAQLNMAKAAPMMGELNALLQREDDYDFYSSDEYVSTDRDRPTIFQNFVENYTPAGALVAFPGFGKAPMPFGIRMAARTEAVGYIDGDTFKGTMQLSYEFAFDSIPPMVRRALEAQIGPIPATPRAQGGGVFEVKLLNL
ncbi:type I restriction enzyme HsdR N-terminal domain-containing protein [Caulobacter segnis]|uniref:type I restriction enzyme HsdR N-terminal domain-containing protein n=1 Tax=Caulobacter segnis TaxID=88688 RepID=UPI00285F1BDA|nr:type I restriction enzyme HsdR N-terminal domain-containing protein [Caulobacter segnis]MDR6624849.1 hypothetical protein [Caulobacter segnis]